MDRRVNTDHLRANLRATLLRVSEGETIEVTRSGQVVAVLVPPPVAVRPSRRKRAKSISAPVQISPCAE